MNKTCKNCEDEIFWNDFFLEWEHKFTGDPQCTDTKGEFTDTVAEPKARV